MEAPYGFIQWKGTVACIDLHCECGAHLHADTDFLYAFQCGECGAWWNVEPYVRLSPQSKDDIWYERGPLLKDE
jgi:hypothetical protein